MSPIVNKPEIELTHEERYSPLWQKLDQLTSDRLAMHRRKNDVDQAERTTALLRGRISELKKLRQLLAMETSPAQETDG